MHIASYKNLLDGMRLLVSSKKVNTDINIQDEVSKGYNAAIFHMYWFFCDYSVGDDSSDISCEATA